LKSVGALTTVAIGDAMSLASQNYCVFEVAGGFCAIAWNSTGITRLCLPSTSVTAATRLLVRKVPRAVLDDAPPAEIASTMAAIERYFVGKPVDFSQVSIELSDQGELYQRIYRALRNVGWGQTTTYGALAKELGAGPEGARDVGEAMARNPIPLLIPCHRVLAAGGKVGGFSAPGGASTKIRMLALEGVRLDTSPSPQQSLF
jgi:methylated-DNA-[protein]-cysteine S-methyltransferase